MGDLTILTTTTPNTTEPDLGTTTSTDTTTNELDLEVVPDDWPYPDRTSDDEKRRAFILGHFHWDNNINAKIQVEALALIDKWLSGR